jgi:Fe-S cluster assembly protein SufD
MTDFMQQPLDSAAASAPPWLQDLLRDGRQRWQGSDLPTRKTESWKYTSLQGLRKTFAPAEASAVDPADLAIELPDLAGYRLVFVNGHHREELSSGSLPEGVQLVRFADADAAQAQRIRSLLGSAVGNASHLFTALNDAALAEGVFLDIAADAVVSEPLQIVWLTGNQAAAFSVNQRLLVAGGANSRARLVEHFASAGGAQQAFTNGVTEILLEPGASLEHYRLHLEEAAAMHIGGVYTRLDRQATLDSFHLALGSDLKRIDVVVNHQGEGAHCQLNGVYLPRGTEHIDFHTCIEHAVPHCTSSETFRGIIADQASAVFNGRIHIHPDAQKTRAELSNKNLLTSASAEVNTKPELEIYADDVQCAHGATVAQLDALSLHYLRTRGVSRDEAEVMLSFGFICELIDGIGCEPLRDYLRPLLARRFARDPALRRHLL